MNDRSAAFTELDRLLQEHGRHDLLIEVRKATASLDAFESHDRTIAQVTRSMLESEKTHRLVFSHEIDAMSLFDPASGMFLDVNDSWVIDVSGEPAQTATAIARFGPGSTLRIDVRWHRAKDGTVFPVELTAGRLVLEGREVMYAVMRDITQRHRAEHQLARSESSYRALMESMPDGVIVHRLGRIVYMSPSSRRMLGYEHDDSFMGKPAIDLVHPDDQPKVLERVLATLANGGAAAPLEERLVRRDGTFVVAEVAALNTTFDGESAVLAIARDITARKEIAAQLVMTDRLTSLGRLAASVGHELNNPLAYVLGNVALMEHELARSPEMPEDVARRFATYVQVVGEGARRMRGRRVRPHRDQPAARCLREHGGAPAPRAHQAGEGVPGRGVGHRQRDAPRPGVPEPARECRAVDPRRDERGARGAHRRAAGGGPRHHRDQRHRLRGPRERRRPHLRALLHHQGR